MKHRSLLLLAGAVAFSSCTTNSSYSYRDADLAGRASADEAPASKARGRSLAESSDSDGFKKRSAKPDTERPGLATAFGSEIASPWNRQSFVRNSSSPAGTGAIYYNDREGVEAMSGGASSDSATHKIAGGMVEWGIKGSFGYLPSYSTYRRDFVVGTRDGNYSIVLKNLCKSRVEVVLSVDGLDVIDGKPASMSKQGYVIAPDETLEVKGWRTSPDTVARFKFSTVSTSYTSLSRGETRNVGVIGAAVFGEKGVDAWRWMPNEVHARDTANPFAH